MSIDRTVENFGRWLAALSPEDRSDFQRRFREAAYAKASTGDPEAVALVQVFDPAYKAVK